MSLTRTYIIYTVITVFFKKILMVQVTDKHNPRKASDWLILAGMIGPVGLAICIVIAGLLRPGYSPMRQAISDLGTQSNAWLLNIPLILGGICITLFGISFYTYAQKLPSRKQISFLLGFFGILLGSSGIFHAPGSHGSGGISGFLHYFLGLFVGTPVLITGLFKAGSQIRKYTTWSSFGRYTTVTAWLVLGNAIIMFPFFMRNSPLYTVGIGGLLERLLFAIVLSWYTIASLLLFIRRRINNAPTALQ